MDKSKMNALAIKEPKFPMLIFSNDYLIEPKKSKSIVGLFESFEDFNDLAERNQYRVIPFEILNEFGKLKSKELSVIINGDEIYLISEWGKSFSIKVKRLFDDAESYYYSPENLNPIEKISKIKFSVRHFPDYTELTGTVKTFFPNGPLWNPGIKIRIIQGDLLVMPTINDFTIPDYILTPKTEILNEIINWIKNNFNKN